MKLAVNGWRLRTGTGVARVLLNVLRYWTPETLAGRFDEITVYTPVPLEPALPLPSNIRPVVVPPDRRMLIWENLNLPRVMKADVLLCPSYSRPLFTSTKTVSLIYEATQKLYPEHYPLQARFIQTPLYGWSARHSTLVVTNTRQAREDIIKAYRAPPEKVRVVPLASAEVFRQGYDKVRLRDVARKYVGGDAPYFLYVGKLTARRNVPRLVEALAEMKRRWACPHKLLIVGLNTTSIALERLFDKLGVAEDVRYYPFVVDEDLAPLYSGAEALVLPYSYESAASLTLLEAQAAGAPVITSGTEGLREAAGNGALFLPDVQVSTLADAMLRVAQDLDLRQSLIAAGARNAARYSWRRCSEEILDVLYEAAKRR